MDDAPPSNLTRRQFLVGGAAGAAAVWAVPKLGWWGSAGAEQLAPADAAAALADGTFTTLPFRDNFDQEFPGGLLTNWSITRPVQVVGTSQFGARAQANTGFDTTAFLDGHGIVVAMDGVLANGTGPGRIESVQTFYLPSARYTLSFQVAGSHHGEDDWPGTLIASVPGSNASMTVVRSVHDDFMRFDLHFLVSHADVSTIVFESADAPGQHGLILDDVSLVADTA